jgi:uncharacterized protein (TIGR02145 family)
MRTSSRKGKRFFAPALAATLALALVLTLTSCEPASGKSVLAGRWESVKDTLNNTLNMELLSDGTGILNFGSKSRAITWKVEKDRFYMIDSRSQDATSHSYKISGSTLAFTDDKGNVDKLNKNEKCGDKWYNLVTQSCKGNEIVNDRCNGKAYNLLTQSCKGNEIVNDKCNGKAYNLKTEYCSDGTIKKYTTVKIGEQTWMAENLNYNIKGSKCYGEGHIGYDEDYEEITLSSSEIQANCNKYGRLYDWETAMKACPKGWHLPSDAEWTTLKEYVESNSGCSRCAGTHLKSASGWNSNGNGEDTYGFSALPGGGGYFGDYFLYVGDRGLWWSSSENDSSYAYSRGMGYAGGGVGRSNHVKRFLYSVRCVRD